jgi:hypothetical protein
MLLALPLFDVYKIPCKTCFNYFRGNSMRIIKITLFVLLGLSCAAQAQTSVNATIGGVLAPGVYGRIDVSNGPPPMVIYPQPIIIAPMPVAVVQQPIYMHVPPGHARKWAKHCHKYNACNQPVYFVQANYAGYEGKKRKHEGKHQDDDGERGHGHGKHGD